MDEKDLPCDLAPNLAPDPAHDDDVDVVAARARLLALIAQVAKNTGREAVPDLVAVTKTQPWSRIAPLLQAGQRIFGENRVQEANARWGSQKQLWPDLELRLIGPLQTNKLKLALKVFDVIETLDRESLAKGLAEAADHGQSLPRLYVQVNIGEESQKSGVLPENLTAFLRRVRKDYGLEPQGLMAIPPVGQPSGPYFALLARFAKQEGLAKLSMGMSGDFETAIGFGATSLRLGTAIFGARS